MEVIDITRHQSVFTPSEHDYPIHIIGAGATGSRIFASLIDLGVTNIKVYDFDVVESHNLANQIYTAADVNAMKVDACRNYAANKLGVEPHALPTEMEFVADKITGASIRAGMHIRSGGVVFILTDTMQSRKALFKALIAPHEAGVAGPGRSQSADVPFLIIETRMGSTHGNVFTINPYDFEQRAAWLNTLVDDTDEDNIELSPCGTTLSVGPTASLIANYAVWQMMQFFTDPLSVQPQVDLFFKPTLTITSSAIAA